MKNTSILLLASLMVMAATANATTTVPSAPEPAETAAPAAPAQAPQLVAPAPPAAPSEPSAKMIPPAAPMPAPSPAIPLAKKVELIDGSWALVDGDNVKISTDNGENWAPAPDQTWVARDGSKLATKNGKILK